MSTNWPAAIDTYTDRVDNVDDVRAAHVNNLQHAMTAVQTSLGTNFGRGTAFPSSPAAGTVFFRTDLGWWCFYDGTRWLTCEEFLAHAGVTGATLGSTTTQSFGRSRSDHAHYVTRIALATYVATTNDATHNWTIDIKAASATLAATTMLHSASTSGDSPNTNVDKEAAPGTSQTPANYGFFQYTGTKNNTPGNLTLYLTVYYRLIVT